jgi:hypothetical protein
MRLFDRAHSAPLGQSLETAAELCEETLDKGTTIRLNVLVD